MGAKFFKKLPKKRKKQESEEIQNEPKIRNPKSAKKPQRKKRDPFYNSHEWKLIRMDALKRSNFSCEACGAEKGDYTEDNTRKTKLTAHHIIPRSINPDLSLDLDNIVILCEACHQSLDISDRTSFKKKQENLE